MKQTLYVLIGLIFTFNLSASTGFSKSGYLTNGNKLGNNSIVNGIDTINVYDTLFMDLQAATLNGNLLTIPLYIHSDDTVVSLDFSFGYDSNVLTLDTVITKAPEIDYNIYFLNPNDSTLRYSSNSLSVGRYPIDSLLLVCRFIVSGGTVTPSNFNRLKAYPNGNISTFYIKYSGVGIQELKSENVKVFPSPANSNVTIETEEKGNFYLYNAAGSLVWNGFKERGADKLNIETQLLQNGVYILHQEKNAIKPTRITVVH